MKKLKKNLLPILLGLPLNLCAAEPIKISGIMEIDATVGSDYSQKSISDIALSKLELAFDADINTQTIVHVLVLHEDDDTEPMQLDEATVTMQLGKGWYFNGGRMAVPFGVYETNFVTDPVTKELGEAHEAALQIGYAKEGLYGSLYAFNGDTIRTSTALEGDDRIEHFGAKIGYIVTSGETSLNIGADFISSLADSNTVYELMSINTDTDGDTIADRSTLDRYAKGVALHGIFSNGPWIGIVEHLRSSRFQPAELSFNGDGAAPTATNIEAAYSFNWGTVAAAYQTTHDALALALPRQRKLVGLSMKLLENSTLNIEYSKSNDYDSSVGGTGASSTQSTIQLAITF